MWGIIAQIIMLLSPAIGEHARRRFYIITSDEFYLLGDVYAGHFHALYIYMSFQQHA